MEKKDQHLNIALTPVKSSQIMAIGFHPETGTAAVQFKGGSIYHYPGQMTAEGFEQFKKSKSIGTHFASTLQKSKDFKKLPPPKKAN